MVHTEIGVARNIITTTTMKEIDRHVIDDHDHIRAPLSVEMHVSMLFVGAYKCSVAFQMQPKRVSNGVEMLRVTTADDYKT